MPYEAAATFENLKNNQANTMMTCRRRRPMTFFQAAVLALLALNLWITYYMLSRLAIATLTGSFMIANWLNPIRVGWFKENYEKNTTSNDEKLSQALAEENPECALGREAHIANAFSAYKECSRVPESYRISV
jgi:hypothetical protein